MSARIARDRSSKTRLQRHAAGIIVAAAFFVVSVLNLHDYGLTLDENESYQAGGLDLYNVKAAVSGTPLQDWYLHQLSGYSFIVDTIGSAFTRLLSRELDLMDWVLGFHLFHILLSTLALCLVYRLAYEVSGRSRIAILSMVGLAVFPQFVAHSQNNPKDLPGLLTLVLAIFSFTRLHDVSALRQVLFAGVSWGLALTTHVSAVLLVPLFGIWHLVTGRRLPFRSYVSFAAVATATAFLCWPWLWAAPFDRLSSAMRHVANRFGFESFLVLYLGRDWQAWDLPWHYTPVSLLALIPVLYLAWILCSIVRLRARGEGSAGNPANAAVLGWSWCAIMMAAEAAAPMRYDGPRHLLIIAPGLCLLAAIGFDAVLERIERIPRVARSAMQRRAVTPACAAVAFAFVGAQVVQIHPYQNAYLNEVANAWITGRAEDTFEVEYWGQSYKEGADWINRHVEPDAAVYIAFADEVAIKYLKPRFLFLDEESLPRFEDPARPAYLMLMTRKAWYGSAATHVVRRYEPVFEVRRQKGTLLAVYSNRRPAANPDPGP